MRLFDGSALEPAGSFSSLFAEAANDRSFCHVSDASCTAPIGRLIKDKNLFGPGRSVAHEIFIQSVALLQKAESVILHDTVFIPSACIVHSPSHGFYAPSMVGFTHTSEDLPLLSNFGPIFKYRGPDLSLDPNVPVADIDTNVIPISGHGFFNYGHFLFDGLPLGHMALRELRLRGRSARLIGLPLRQWQKEILEILDISEFYHEIVSPVRAKTVTTSNLLSNNVAFPTRLTRILFEEILWRCGEVTSDPRRLLYIDRKESVQNRRRLLNREEVANTFAGWGFEVVRPETMTVREQIAMFSAAGMVAGESGAGMANIGFCPPGTPVLELQPECFVEGWTRAMCLLFGHPWHVYFARQVGVAANEPGEKKHEFEYVIDIPELVKAVEKIKSS